MGTGLKRAITLRAKSVKVREQIRRERSFPLLLINRPTPLVATRRVMGSGCSQRRQDIAFKGRSSLPPPRGIACRMTPYRSRIAAGQPFPAISAGTWDQSCSGVREARRPASRAAPDTVRNALRERLHITCRCGGIDHAAVKNPFITRPPLPIPLPASLRDAVIVLARAGVGIFLTVARLLSRRRIRTTSPNATIRCAVSRCIFVAPHPMTR